jgi:XTP/dITP diphosphohydrolase
MTRKLLVGSNNIKKRNEIRRILGDLGFEILTPQEAAGGADGNSAELLTEPEETGETFIENATIKALHYAAASGMLTIADDSGLSVDALGGLPGVRSSRYAGENATDEENCAKLLEAMRDVPDAERTARFQCAVVVAGPEGVLAEALGTCRGIIMREKAGEGGFGYDPLFYYPPEERTFAQLAPEVKNRVSHRGDALRRIRRALEKI